MVKNYAACKIIIEENRMPKVGLPVWVFSGLTDLPVALHGAELRSY